MSAISAYLGTAWLNHVLRNIPYTSPGTSVYVSAYLSDPEDDDSGTEVAALYAYARVQAIVWTAPSNEIVYNDSPVTFPAASGGNWGILTHLAIHDASTSGNLLFRGPLVSPITIDDGDQLIIPTSQLAVALQ